MSERPEPLVTADVYFGLANDDYCGSDPPQGVVTDEQGRQFQYGDCWCTLPPEHEGLCHCEPCTARFGAPGWQAGG